METSVGVALFLLGLWGYNSLVEKIKNASGRHEVFVRVMVKTPQLPAQDPENASFSGFRATYGEAKFFEKKLTLPIPPAVGMYMDIETSGDSGDVIVKSIKAGETARVYCDHLVSKGDFNGVCEGYKEDGWYSI